MKKTAKKTVKTAKKTDVEEEEDASPDAGMDVSRTGRPCSLDNPIKLSIDPSRVQMGCVGGGGGGGGGGSLPAQM